MAVFDEMRYKQAEDEEMDTRFDDAVRDREEHALILAELESGLGYWTVLWNMLKRLWVYEGERAEYVLDKRYSARQR